MVRMHERRCAAEEMRACVGRPVRQPCGWRRHTRRRYATLRPKPTNVQAHISSGQRPRRGREGRRWRHGTPRRCAADGSAWTPALAEGSERRGSTSRRTHYLIVISKESSRAKDLRAWRTATGRSTTRAGTRSRRRIAVHSCRWTSNGSNRTRDGSWISCGRHPTRRH